MGISIGSVFFKVFDETQLKCLSEKLCEVSLGEFPHLPSVDYEQIYVFWESMLKQGNFFGLNAYIGNDLVGVINGHILEHPYNKDILVGKELTWWVAKEHRNSDIGKLLLDGFEETLKLNGAKNIIMSLLHKDDDLTRKLNAFYLRKNYKVFETYYIKEI